MRKQLLAVLTAAALAVSVTACALEKEPAPVAAGEYPEYHWNASMTVADTTINYKMVERFAKLLNERSGGSITVDIYPGGQLGNTTEFTEAVIGGFRDGNDYRSGGFRACAGDFRYSESVRFGGADADSVKRRHHGCLK